MSEQEHSSTKKSRVFPVLVVVWGVLLTGLAVWSARSGHATVVDQTTVDSAKQTIDSTVQQLGGGLPAQWSVVDQGYAESVCELTVAREGVELRRTLSLSGPKGTENATLGQLAAHLGDAKLQPAEGAPEKFFKDVGNFVAIRGRVDSPGEIRIALDSGCRAR